MSESDSQTSEEDTSRASRWTRPEVLAAVIAGIFGLMGTILAALITSWGSSNGDVQKETVPPMTKRNQHHVNELRAPTATFQTDKLTRLSSEMPVPLQLAYGAEIDDPPPRAAIQLVVRRSDAADDEWQPIESGDSLSSADRYRIVFRAEDESCFYVFQIDTAGKLDWLFPRNKSPFSFGANPVTPGQWVHVPDGDAALHLDENLGVEHVYVVGTRRNWEELEKTLEDDRQAKPAGDPKPINKAFALKTRGVGGVTTAPVYSPNGSSSSTPDDVMEVIEGTAGVLVKEIWFEHVAPPAP